MADLALTLAVLALAIAAASVIFETFGKKIDD